jgi:ABC-2 type transport system ATP-binding protein
MTRTTDAPDIDAAAGTEADSPAAPLAAGAPARSPSDEGRLPLAHEPSADRESQPSVRPATGEPSEPIAILEHASRRFDDIVAVEDVSLVLPPGTILGVIGPSGSGKTTTIRMLTGAISASSGVARVLGRNPRTFPASFRRRIGYMPQQFAHYPDLSARENVDFAASLYGLGWRQRRRRVPTVLKTVDLWAARSRRAGKLSGGMQRRLELACALVHDPTLLFLDEPTAGIDPLLRATIWEELHRLREAGRTLLVSTQWINEAEECDAVALISCGRLLELATPDELRRRAAGGDVVDLELDGPLDPDVIARVDGVRAVEPMGHGVLRATVADAGSATPQLVEAATDAGRTVTSAREVRISFDEVFAALVYRDDDARVAAGGETRQEAEAAG